jgi:hypothetical protein
VLAKDFLDRVESKPLTEEQARAVICFDNRVQVVAAAGSGKTSTMVAKAAYAIDRGFVEPERIVMLAFNKDAAKELEERAQRCFDRLGMGDTVVRPGPSTPWAWPSSPKPQGASPISRNGRSTRRWASTSWPNWWTT